MGARSFKTDGLWTTQCIFIKKESLNEDESQCHEQCNVKKRLMGMTRYFVPETGLCAFKEHSTPGRKLTKLAGFPSRIWLLGFEGDLQNDQELKAALMGVWVVLTISSSPPVLMFWVKGTLTPLQFLAYR